MLSKQSQKMLKNNDRNQICAIIVTYYPTESLAENVAALAPQVAEIIIIDNGSSGYSIEMLRQIELHFGCRLICNNQNMGIAAALNVGVRYAISAGYDWLATFDQDSTVPDGFIAAMLSGWESCPFRDQVALVSPRCRDRQTDLVSSYGSKTGGGTFVVVSNTITSGNLLRSEIFAKAGLFDESFFIDCVDHEFCLRLRRHGYRLIEVRAAVLQHSLGNMTLHSLFGKSCKVYNHPSVRRYYNARNRVVVYKRYALTFPCWIVHDLSNFCREIVGIILFEQNVSAKLAAIGKGIVHGLIGKMGKAAWA